MHYPSVLEQLNSLQSIELIDSVGSWKDVRILGQKLHSLRPDQTEALNT